MTWPPELSTKSEETWEYPGRTSTKRNRSPVLLPSRAYGQPVSGINKNTRHKQAARAREFRNFPISSLDAAATPPPRLFRTPAGVIFVLRRVRIKRSMAG